MAGDDSPERLDLDFSLIKLKAAKMQSVRLTPCFVLLIFFGTALGWRKTGVAADRSVRVTIVDADSGVPLAARVYLRSDAGESYYFQSEHESGSAVRYEKQNWINKQSVEYHTTVSAHPCVAMVPEG